MKFLKKEKGFTLIELLVVISIIGVLATIIISNLNDARNKTNYLKTGLQYKKIEEAFFLAALLDENRNQYWTINDLGGASHPNLKSISEILAIENGPGSTVSNYLSESDALLFNGSDIYYYHASGSSPDCSWLVYGIGLAAYNNTMSTNLLDDLNEYFDGEESDPKCGDFVRRGGTADIYRFTKNTLDIEINNNF